MVQVIGIEDAFRARAKRGLPPPEAFFARVDRAASPLAGQPSLSKENLFRAILLLDLAAQRVRVLVKETADASRREVFEAQISNIEELLQLARDLALKL